MTDLIDALARVLAGHRDPFAAPGRTQNADEVFAEVIAAGESWHESSPHRRVARERADKESAR